MKERLLSRREFLKVAGATAAGVILGGCRVVIGPGPTTAPNPVENPTETSTPTFTPTLTATPEATSTPEPSPTPKPEIPKVEGLRLVEEGDKKIFLAEKDNPYGLKENELAGRVIGIKIFEGMAVYFENRAKEVQETPGLVLALPVVEELFLKANAPEKLEPDTWQVPFPFDPGEKVTITESMINHFYGITVSGIPEDVFAKLKIVYFYPEAARVASYQRQKPSPRQSVVFYVPEKFLPEKGITNWGVSVYFLEGETTVSNEGRDGVLGEVIISNIKGTLPPPFSKEAQLDMVLGTHYEPRSFRLKNILNVNNVPIFILDK